MKNYKPVLKVLAKPESATAIYLSACFAFGLALILYATFYQALFILALPVYSYVCLQSWNKYYRLTAKNAVQSLQINADDTLSVWCVNSSLEAEQIDVEVVDMLLLGETVVLYFRRLKEQESVRASMPEPDFAKDVKGVLEKFKSYLRNKKRSFSRDIVLFFSFSRLSLVVSAKTMGVDEFKELLRRLN